MSRWLLALLLLAAGAPAAQARDALTVIDECIAQLDRGLDIGYERIAARCPELAASLTQSPWAKWLPPDWNQPKNQLSALGLSELRTLLAREASPRAVGHAPDTGRVGAVLAGIARTEEPAGWWARFKRWLRELLAPRPAADGTWLRRLFAGLEVSHSVLEMIAWVGLALIIALAAAIVINELRVAGLLKPRRARAQGASPGTGRRVAASLRDIGSATALEQPGLLLELIAARLGELDRLPPARALTAREVAREARLPVESARTPLAELAAVCERVRFSDREVPVPILAAALAGGREVLAALEAPLVPQQSAG